MLQQALLDVRLLPWRPRARVMDPAAVPDADPTLGADDLSGVVLGLALWLVIILAAPLIVLVLAGLLFTIEVPVAAAVGLLLVVARFAGVIPWTVVVLDSVSGTETTERYRNLLHAVRRIRSVNHDRRVQVRWAWA